ncbi:hypothetical protein ACWT_1353 [Actinoplanes sp. SE50]|uniref:DUF2254 domain-containing protein n=1 Tax=unclassified Actinoplanes TaxID=2626549 RepID=UPI00023EBE91|nr:MULTISPECIES: DUF2254 domain-containing protein [unclassified Actinoplanes]AEV82371.1 uncharacterized protein ACPL_1474 [Actinoplanes sp. SE50/110]ATO80768.1 hypothetical protein ACWT_1353 [Actinoplanes sp. SE50]SLL98176.1 uncharacterized protein ACSP50_1400 [Actinoplanes sp. SE50/110]
MEDDTHASIAPSVRRLRQRAIGDRLRESLLFLPMLLLAAGILAETAAREIDRSREPAGLGLFAMSSDAAVTLLSTIAGATITTAGVVFSLLVVSLQLASGQFSPRVLRTFWRDRIGQVLIGLLLATFAFCVLALGHIDSQDQAPRLTMTLAVGLSLASVLAIVVFLNRITRQQYVGRIMERIQHEAIELIDDLPYGSRMGIQVGAPIAAPRAGEPGDALAVRSPADGWVQQISHPAILAAVPPGSTVRLETRVGAYLIRDEPLVRIWPRPAKAQAHRIAQLIAEAVVIGATRTMQQDIDFALRQLNDIGLRALSPAVNDPTTAVESILRVSSVMRPLLQADLPAQAHRDDRGRSLLTPWDLDHAEYVRHAYGQIRLFAGGHPQVALTLIRVLRMLRDVVAAREDRAATLVEIDRQLDAVIDDARRAGLPDSELAPIRESARRRQE